jgi:hypothetical protein
MTRLVKSQGRICPRIESSAASHSSDCGVVRPSALAVFALMTNSNLVRCSIGRSAGFVPLRIRLMYAASRWNISAVFGPRHQSNHA